MKKSNSHLDVKIKEYKIAIEKYQNVPLYTRVEIFIAVMVVSLQIATFTQLIHQYDATSIITILITLFIAYIATDFINGLVHMIVDNSTNYTSVVGPYVAAFHLHHTRLTYQNKHVIKIFFYESGHKIWLFFYLWILCFSQHLFHLNFCFNLFLVAIGFLSSLAELSHFWCHNSTRGNALVRWLQKYRILLSMKHHRIHHTDDNVNYAFLNGMTDPFLNKIAHYFYRGYKNFSDRHVMAYERNEKMNCN